MKTKLLLALLCVMAVVLPARAEFVINGKTYSADTLFRRQVGPGMMNTIVRIPDWPLNVYVVEVDLNNPNNRVETTYGYNTLGKTEKLADAVVRHRTPTKRPLVACNANFWVVSGNWLYFQPNFPAGGVVCNDTTIVNDNNTVDQWGGGPTCNGVAAITQDKTILMGHLKWSGFINSDKFAQPIEFQNYNRRAVTGEICLFTRPYTNDKHFEDDWINTNTRGDNRSDNYFLSLEPGSQWGTNAPMKFRVDSIVKSKDRRRLNSKDACIAVTGDANKEKFAVLQVGDVIEITSGWTQLDADVTVTSSSPIENLVTGNSTIMHNGVLTSRNTEDGYNTPAYSRTCYGTSADGKHLYLLVIDKSASKEYGTSLGCTTAEACTILSQMCPDVTEIVNMDAGGSAEMLVHGKVINTTTEGTPRGVACGWMVEAIGEEDDQVASIAFDQYRLDIPESAVATPRILGYNKIGEMVSEDVKGVTLTCSESVGTATGDTFRAVSQEAYGTITATVNGMTATIPVHVMPAKPYILLNPLVIDEREYPVEVAATMVNKVYFYDTTNFGWTIDNEAVATIADGKLRGVSNGTANLLCDIGSSSLKGKVKVEVSDEPYRYESWSGWTKKGTGAKNLVLDEETGRLTFDYATNRLPSIKLSKELVLFGLPDTVGLVFNSTMPINYVQIDTRNYFYTKTNYIRFDPEDGAASFETGKDHLLLLNLKELGGVDYVGTYPINIKSIKFNLEKTAEEKDYEINLKALYCHYPNKNVVIPPVPGDVNGDNEVNIADVNAVIDVILTSRPNDKADVNGDGEVNIADVSALIEIILAD